MNPSSVAFLGVLSLLVGSGALASSTSSVVTTVNANWPACVVEVPDSVSIASWSNSTMHGSSVTFSNGTEMIFPADTCVRPVYSSIYALDAAIESNGNFTIAENGSRFAPPASYETCSQFSAQLAGGQSVVCPPQGPIWAKSYQVFTCPGGASNVSPDADCPPYVMLSFGLFGKTLIQPCSNLLTVNELQELNVYVPDSNGTFDTSSVFVQTDNMPVAFMCTTILGGQGTSTSQSIQTVETSSSTDGSSTNATSQAIATNQSVSSSQTVEGGQLTNFATIGIIVAVAVVASAMVMTRMRRG